MDQQTLKELTHELDHALGSINVRRETLEALSDEMGKMQDDVQNTDQMDKSLAWYKLHEIRSTLLVLTELLRHTVNELNEDYDKSHIIKESLFDIVVRSDSND